MSLDLLIGDDWGSFFTYVLPSPGAIGSSVNISNKKLTCISVVGESAKATKHVPVRPGERLTVSCLARITSSDPDDSASIAIDSPAAGNQLSQMTIRGGEWREYSVSAVVPKTFPEDSYAAFQFGIFGSATGTVEMIQPRISKGNAAIGVTQCVARGFLFFDKADSLPKINQGFSNAGIKSLSYAGSELSVTIDKSKINDTDPNEQGTIRIPIRPTFEGTTSFDANGATIACIKWGQYNRKTGIVKGRFYDFSGALVDMTTILGAGNIFFTFKAEV